MFDATVQNEARLEPDSWVHIGTLAGDRRTLSQKRWRSKEDDEDRDDVGDDNLRFVTA